MKMTFRWYGSQTDPIPLKYIKQIPGMTGLMGLLEKPAGADWPEEEFAALKKEVNDAGLEIEVIESVNVHEDIKLGVPSRDEYIANYISTIRMLAKHGVKVIALPANMSVALEAPELLTQTDLFICNHIEAGRLFGLNTENMTPEELLAAAEELLRLVKNRRGMTNKDNAKLTAQIRSLINKWQ